jgi:hypothetical protein
LVFGQHASVLPGKREVQLCVCYPQVLAAILMASPNRSIQNRDHDQPRQCNGKCNYLITGKMSFGCHDVPPAEPVARLAARHALSDVYPRFGSVALMSQCPVQGCSCGAGGLFGQLYRLASQGCVCSECRTHQPMRITQKPELTWQRQTAGREGTLVPRG